MMSAREIPVLRDRALEFAPPESITSATASAAATELGIRFPSMRASASLRALRECLTLLGLPDSSYRGASTLAGLAGTYQLDDKVASRLRREGVELGNDGELPYTAALDFLSPERFRHSEARGWPVHAIRDFFEERGIELAGWRLDAESEYALSIVLHAGGSALDPWRALDALDALECHRRTHLELWARRINPVASAIR